MNEKTFRWTLNLFELEFVVKQVVEGKLGILKPLSTLPGKLTASKFGKYMGLVFPCDSLIVIDYYGYWKRSSAFKSKSIQQWANEGLTGAKTLDGVKVDFASIKIEQVSSIGVEELTLNFADMKQHIIEVRGFGDSDENIRAKRIGDKYGVKMG